MWRAILTFPFKGKVGMGMGSFADRLRRRPRARFEERLLREQSHLDIRSEPRARVVAENIHRDLLSRIDSTIDDWQDT